MKTTPGNLVGIALRILAITVPVISILSNIEENREGINNLYALGSLIVIVILFKYGVRSVKRKKVLGWIMIAAAIALFFDIAEGQRVIKKTNDRCGRVVVMLIPL